jgi:dual specificity tyrosine-phosphorylation-regulated kinase 2/3/4
MSKGCILAELLTGSPLFPGSDEIDQLGCIIELLGMPKNKTIRNLITAKGYPSKCTKYVKPDGKQAYICSYQRWSQPRGLPGTKLWSTALKGCQDKLCIDFIRRCLDWDPVTRMTPNLALKHPWFKQINNPQPNTTTTTNNINNKNNNNNNNVNNINNNNDKNKKIINNNNNNDNKNININDNKNANTVKK